MAIGIGCGSCSRGMDYILTVVSLFVFVFVSVLESAFVSAFVSVCVSVFVSVFVSECVSVFCVRFFSYLKLGVALQRNQSFASNSHICETHMCCLSPRINSVHSL